MINSFKDFLIDLEILNNNSFNNFLLSTPISYNLYII